MVWSHWNSVWAVKVGEELGEAAAFCSVGNSAPWLSCLGFSALPLPLSAPGDILCPCWHTTPWLWALHKDLFYRVGVLGWPGFWPSPKSHLTPWLWAPGTCLCSPGIPLDQETPMCTTLDLPTAATENTSYRGKKFYLLKSLRFLNVGTDDVLAFQKVL